MFQDLERNKMNYREVKKNIRNELECFLLPIGYTINCGAQGCTFQKTSNKIENVIGFAVANYNPLFNTGCYIQANSLQIERIRTILFGEEGGSAVAANLGDYFKTKNYRFDIRSINDIIEFGNLVKKFYQEFAIPFFERYGSLNAIDKLLNENFKAKVEIMPDQGWRIIKGLIAAKLNQNPKYEEIRAYYKSFVETNFQGYFMYEKCIKTIEFLDQHSWEELNEMANQS